MTKGKWERSFGLTATVSQIPKIWTFLQSSTHFERDPSLQLSVFSVSIFSN